MDSCISTPILPIQSVQLTLEDSLVGPMGIIAHIARRILPDKSNGWDDGEPPDLQLDNLNILGLRRPYCPICGRPLCKWGTNKRKLILEHGEVPEIKGIQRYRCAQHGEMSDYLQQIVPKFANYAKPFAARSRNLYFVGQPPAMIRKTFTICYGNSPKETTIRNWVDEATEDIAKCVNEITVPTSGYHGYDEIHINLRGEKAYILTAIDLNTHFATGASYSPDLNKNHLKSFLQTLKSGPQHDIKGLVKDGVISFGKLFGQRGFDRIALQRCVAHYKKNLNEKIYNAAGLGKKLKKPLPEPFDKVKQALFAPFNRSTYLRAIFQLEWADHCLRDKVNKDVNKILDELHRDVDKLFQFHIDTQLEPTNNRVERFNNELETYPSLKKRMMTEMGVQRVIDGERYFHNLREFSRYIPIIEERIQNLETFIEVEPKDEDLKNARRGAIMHLNWVKRWKQDYDDVYDRYFRI